MDNKDPEAVALDAAEEARQVALAKWKAAEDAWQRAEAKCKAAQVRRNAARKGNAP